MLDIDIGPALLQALLVFIVLPLAVAAVATAATVRLVRDTTRRLAIGLYMMLAGVLVTPAPIVWGDDHLGFPSSQALESYGALFWAVGAITSLDSLTGALKRRQALVLAFGLIVAAIVLCGWVLVGIGTGVRLALMPAVGTLEVLLALGWLAHQRALVGSAIDWRRAAGAGATCACAMAAYVYLRGPQAFGSQASGVDLALLALLACLPVVGLARVRALTARPLVATSEISPMRRMTRGMRHASSGNNSDEALNGGFTCGG